MEDENPYNDPLQGDYEASCKHCGWTTKLRLNLGAGLKIGDKVYADPDNQFFGRCNRCRRHGLYITQSPEREIDTNRQGFWRVPSA